MQRRNLGLQIIDVEVKMLTGIGTFRGKPRLWAHYKLELLPSLCKLLAILSLSQGSIIMVFITLRSKEHITIPLTSRPTPSPPIFYYEAPRNDLSLLSPHPPASPHRAPSPASPPPLFFCARYWQNLLLALRLVPYLMNTNGIAHIIKLRKPGKLHARGTPSFSYIGRAANGRTVPKVLREVLDAAMALAAKISYALTR